MAALRLDGYVRVSRVAGREGESFISPAVQREQVERWAKLRGVEIVEWHEDLDVSGGVLKRPGLDALMERIRTGATGGIAVARLDRLSRAGVADALGLIEEIHSRGGQIAIVDLGADPTTTFGEFATTVMLAMARMERRRLTEGWATAQGAAIERGVQIAPRAIFGYDRGANGRLVPNADSTVVEELYRRRAGGTSWLELARFLDEVRPRTDRHWTRQTVRTMLLSTTYLGEVHHGDHRKAGAHQALVDRDLWEQAQAAPTGRTPRGSYLLSGLVRCASCRHTLRGTTLGRGNGKRAYKCAVHHGAGRCPAPTTVMVEALDAHVERVFLGHLDDFEIRAAESSEGLAGARRALTHAEGELTAFRDDLRVREALGTPSWLEGLEARTTAVREAQERVEHALRASPIANVPPVGDSWGDLALDERRTILTAAVDAVFVRPTGNARRRRPIEDRAHVLFRGEGPADLPQPNRTAGPIVPFTWSSNEPTDLGVAAA